MASRLYNEIAQGIKFDFEINTILNSANSAEAVKKALMERDADGNTLLHLAVNKNSPSLITSILNAAQQHSILENVHLLEDKYGKTPLYSALSAHKNDALNALVDNFKNNPELQEKVYLAINPAYGYDTPMLNRLIDENNAEAANTLLTNTENVMSNSHKVMLSVVLLAGRNQFGNNAINHALHYPDKKEVTKAVFLKVVNGKDLMVIEILSKPNTKCMSPLEQIIKLDNIELFKEMSKAAKKDAVVKKLLSYHNPEGKTISQLAIEHKASQIKAFIIEGGIDDNSVGKQLIQAFGGSLSATSSANALLTFDKAKKEYEVINERGQSERELLQEKLKVAQEAVRKYQETMDKESPDKSDEHAQQTSNNADIVIDIHASTRVETIIEIKPKYVLDGSPTEFFYGKKSSGGYILKTQDGKIAKVISGYAKSIDGEAIETWLAKKLEETTISRKVVEYSQDGLRNTQEQYAQTHLKHKQMHHLPEGTKRALDAQSKLAAAALRKLSEDVDSAQSNLHQLDAEYEKAEQAKWNHDKAMMGLAVNKLPQFAEDVNSLAKNMVGVDLAAAAGIQEDSYIKPLATAAAGLTAAALLGSPVLAVSSVLQNPLTQTKIGELVGTEHVGTFNFLLAIGAIGAGVAATSISMPVAAGLLGLQCAGTAVNYVFKEDSAAKLGAKTVLDLTGTVVTASYSPGLIKAFDVVHGFKVLANSYHEYYNLGTETESSDTTKWPTIDDCNNEASHDGLLAEAWSFEASAA